jgi:PAS domain S-box-containing protein
MASSPVGERATVEIAGGPRAFGERELLGLVDRAPDVIFRFRPRPPAYEFVSRAITRLTGFAPEELYADPALALKLVHHDDRAIAYEFLARGTGRVPIVVRWLRKDGSTIWVEQRNTPVFNPSRELVAIEGIAREIFDPALGALSFVRVHGDIRIDLDRGRVLVGGRDARLTPSEFRLLVLLTAQPGRVVSRQTIAEALWNSPFVGGGKSCEVHISKLRSKLDGGAHTPKPRIETVRRKGYRFIPLG